MDIETFKSQLDITQVIESYIPLKKVGTNYQAICPFHSEKSPSFVVSPQKQIYKCFGCGASGDVLKFVQEYKKLEFAEAVAELADSYNLTNPLSKGGQSEYKVLQEKLKQLSDVFVANLLENGYLGNHSQDLQGLGAVITDKVTPTPAPCKNPQSTTATTNFVPKPEQNLNSHKDANEILNSHTKQPEAAGFEMRNCDFLSGGEGVTLGGNDRSQQEKKHDLSLKANASIAHKLREYLFKRGFNSEDITTFSFGYCKGDEWKQFFSLEQAQKVGIVSPKGYCLFSNRLTITLYNASYKPIGFVARTHPYFNFRNSPKYINSKEGILYQKSKNFYNFWRAKTHIQSSKKVLIVEGYMDALAAWKMGIKNCIATGGTAFNKTFLAQLSSINPEIVFLFDNDDAGQKNTLNAIRVCIENGYSNIYKGNLNEQAKDLGEVLEKLGHSALSDKSLNLHSGFGHYRLGNSLRPSLDNKDFSSQILECQTPNTASKDPNHTATTNFVGKPEIQNLSSHTKTLESGLSYCEAGDNPITRSGASGDLLPASDSKFVLQTCITKIEGVGYYLKTSLNTCASAKDKDHFLHQWKDFVRAQHNHFFKLELMEKTNRALGFDVFTPSAAQHYKPQPLQAIVYKSILISQDCEYIASEYLNGEELGEFKESFLAFFHKGVRDERALKLELDSSIQELVDLAHFRRALAQLIKEQARRDIHKATMGKDYKRARELSHHLHRVQQALS